LGLVTKIEVLYKGQAIISGSLRDLAVLNWQLTGWQPWGGNFVKTDNDVRFVSVPICLGRFPFLGVEAFPAVRRGELQLQVTYGAAVTGIDTAVAQIETCELLDVQPMQFTKYTTLSKTPSSTGLHDMDLPIGNDILGILGFSTTVPTGASYNASLGQMKILVDNVEYGYSQCNWESLHGELYRRKGSFQLQNHIHRGNFTTTVEGDTGLQQYDDAFIQNYAYMDFDPLLDGSYALETAGHSRINARINQEPTADAVRLLPSELIEVASS